MNTLTPRKGILKKMEEIKEADNYNNVVGYITDMTSLKYVGKGVVTIMNRDGNPAVYSSLNSLLTAVNTVNKYEGEKILLGNQSFKTPGVLELKIKELDPNGEYIYKVDEINKHDFSVVTSSGEIAYFRDTDMMVSTLNRSIEAGKPVGELAVRAGVRRTSIGYAERYLKQCDLKGYVYEITEYTDSNSPLKAATMDGLKSYSNLNELKEDVKSFNK